MTRSTTRPRVGLAMRISRWVSHRQQQLSDRIHASGDEFAYWQGWRISESTGRFGFGTRSYRDPRFENRHRGADMAAGRCAVDSQVEREELRR
jgi:hypothetical protein